jgi:excisionase family DNA binding protein
MSPSDILTADQVAEILHISRSHAYELMRSKLPVFYLGSSVRIRRQTLEKWIAHQEQRNTRAAVEQGGTVSSFAAPDHLTGFDSRRAFQDYRSSRP